jgi:tRNA(adenine34) deaminase
MAAHVPSPHDRFMRVCIGLARRARETGDTPVGAVVVRGDEIVGEGAEAVRARGDVTAHAEIEALRAACARVGSLDLSGCTLYTSVEPCMMCAYALRLARISVVVMGARSAAAGPGFGGRAVLTDAGVLPSRPLPSLVSDVLGDECLAVLTESRPR